MLQNEMKSNFQRSRYLKSIYIHKRSGHLSKMFLKYVDLRLIQNETHQKQWKEMQPVMQKVEKYTHSPNKKQSIFQWRVFY